MKPVALDVELSRMEGAALRLIGELGCRGPDTRRMVVKHILQHWRLKHLFGS